MWRYTTIGPIIAGLCGLSGCGNTVSPGQRSPLVPLDRGTDHRDFEVRVLLESTLERCVRHDVRLQSYTELVDALSSDDLLVVEGGHHYASDCRRSVFPRAGDRSRIFIRGSFDRNCWPRCVASCRTIRWSRSRK